MANVTGCIGLISGNVLFADADCSNYRVLCSAAGGVWIYNADCDYGSNDGFYPVRVNSSSQLQVAMPDTCCSHWYFLAGYTAGAGDGGFDAVNGVGHFSWQKSCASYGECRGVSARGTVAAVYAGGRVKVSTLAGVDSWQADHDDARNAVGYEHTSNRVIVANQNVRRYAADGSASEVWTHGAAVYALCTDVNDNIFVGGVRTGSKSVWKLDSLMAEVASFDTGGDVYSVWWSSYYGGGYPLYVVGDRAGNKTLWALDSTDLTELWSIDTGADLRGVVQTSGGWIVCCGVADGAGKTLFVIDNSLHTIHHSLNTGANPTRAVAADAFNNVLAVSGSGLAYTLYDWFLSAQWTVTVTTTIYSLAGR